MSATHRASPAPAEAAAEGALAISYRPTQSLIPYARNARTHSAEQVAQIAASIAEFGFTNPILVGADGVVIAGHGRLAAAQRLGLERVPVVVLEHLSEAQRRAYVLADNKLAEQAGWDQEMLAIELGALLEAEYDATLTGFGEEEIAAIVQAANKVVGLTDEDEAPAVEERAVSRPGELWCLGKHRLLCGDATRAEDVARLLGAVVPHLMVTDPPYGISYDANWRNTALRANGQAIGGRAVGAVQNDDRADWRSAWELFPGDVAYIWHAGVHAATVADSLLAVGFELRAQIVWAKHRHVLSRGHYHAQHEPCFYAVRKGKTGHWRGDRSQTTLWAISHSRSETGHSTQKPVEAMRRPIENNSSPGQAVYEPFSGSGTTLIAAETTGRSCFALEVHPPYVDVAIRRWQAFTGAEATLAEGGQSFAQLARERLGAGDGG